MSVTGYAISELLSVLILCCNEPQRQKRTFGYARPAKIQISLRIRAVFLEFSSGALWIAKDATFLHANNEHFDQNAHMRKLTIAFVVWTSERTFSDVEALMMLYGFDYCFFCFISSTDVRFKWWNKICKNLESYAVSSKINTREVNLFGLLPDTTSHLVFLFGLLLFGLLLFVIFYLIVRWTIDWFYSFWRIRLIFWHAYGKSVVYH